MVKVNREIRKFIRQIKKNQQVLVFCVIIGWYVGSLFDEDDQPRSNPRASLSEPTVVHLPTNQHPLPAQSAVKSQTSSNSGNPGQNQNPNLSGWAEQSPVNLASDPSLQDHSTSGGHHSMKDVRLNMRNVENLDQNMLRFMDNDNNARADKYAEFDESKYQRDGQDMDEAVRLQTLDEGEKIQISLSEEQRIAQAAQQSNAYEDDDSGFEIHQVDHSNPGSNPLLMGGGGGSSSSFDGEFGGSDNGFDGPDWGEMDEEETEEMKAKRMKKRAERLGLPADYKPEQFANRKRAIMANPRMSKKSKMATIRHMEKFNELYRAEFVPKNKNDDPEIMSERKLARLEDKHATAGKAPPMMGPGLHQNTNDLDLAMLPEDERLRELKIRKAVQAREKMSVADQLRLGQTSAIQHKAQENFENRLAEKEADFRQKIHSHIMSGGYARHHALDQGDSQVQNDEIGEQNVEGDSSMTSRLARLAAMRGHSLGETQVPEEEENTGVDTWLAAESEHPEPEPEPEPEWLGFDTCVIQKHPYIHEIFNLFCKI